MLVKQLPVADLKEYGQNSRTHSTLQVGQIAESIKAFGWTNPLLVDEARVLIAGHGRLAAAKLLGLAEVPCIEIAGLSEDKRRALVIADNKLALNAGWDDAALASEIALLNSAGFDLDLLGFTAAEMNKLQDFDFGGDSDPDEVPPVPDDPTSAPGDLWVLGKHRVMCGDSTSIDAVETLMAGKKADFCFTSPPYNAAIKSAQMHSKAPKSGAGGLYVGGYSDDRSSTEYVQFNSDIISALSAVAGENFTCCYNINYNKNSPSEYIDVIHAAKQSIPLVETIVWEKAMAVSLQGDNLTRIFEFVFVLCKGKFKINKNRTDCLKNLWKISNIGANHESHKACFPIKLVEEGIKNFAPHGAVIVEPFGGSGTTLIAAEKLGCNAHLMELDCRYVDVIVRRWQEFTGKQATLESSGATFEQVAADRKT